MKGMILMKRTLASLAVLLVSAVVAGLGVASVTVGHAAEAVSKPYVNHYETPCQTAARAAYGVPLANEPFRQWQLDHLDTPEGAAYNRAALACPQPAKFDFDNMILVGRE